MWKHGENQADISDNIIAIWVCRHVHHHHGLIQAWHGPLGPCHIPSHRRHACHGSFCSSSREVYTATHTYSMNRIYAYINNSVNGVCFAEKLGQR